jgi:hypothetical protein
VLSLVETQTPPVVVHTRIEKLDFELSIGDELRLSDPPRQPLFGHSAVALVSAAVRAEPRVQEIAQTVAEEVQAEHRRRDGRPGEEADPWRLPEVVAAVGDDVAPCRRGRGGPMPRNVRPASARTA